MSNSTSLRYTLQDTRHGSSPEARAFAKRALALARLARRKAASAILEQRWDEPIALAPVMPWCPPVPGCVCLVEDQLAQAPLPSPEDRPSPLGGVPLLGLQDDRLDESQQAQMDMFQLGMDLLSPPTHELLVARVRSFAPGCMPELLDYREMSSRPFRGKIREGSQPQLELPRPSSSSSSSSSSSRQVEPACRPEPRF